MTAEFFEEYSLFRKLNIDVPATLNLVSKPPIHMSCLKCKREQTFNVTNEFWEGNHYMNVPSGSTKIRFVYECQACRSFERVFYVFIDENCKFIYKVGQYPEWEIKIDKQIERALGDHATNFRKGLVCESQSYGIGAFAYYRRIIEGIIDELLNSIVDIIPPEDLEKYSNALERTRKTRVTQDKIEIIKDLIPSILKPSGINPLGVLHSELSEGIHVLSDQDCLEKAHHIKSILTFLLNQIIATKNTASAFSDSMKKLLEKKSNISK